MNSLWRISALVAGSGFLMFAGGINGLILPLRGSIEDFTAFNLGLMGAFWAIGYSGGCLLVPRVVLRAGHIRSFGVLAALAAITILVSLLAVHPAVWIPGRAISGFCFSGAAMIVESWINEQTDSRQRGRVFGFYTMINLAATTAGTVIVPFGNIAGPALFVLAAIFYCLSLLPTALTSTTAPRDLVGVSLDLNELWRNSPVAVVSSLAIGVTNGAFGTLAPVFAERTDLGIGAAALFMGLSLIAGALAQLPVGYVSDRLDRRLILLILATVAAGADLVFFVLQPQGVTYNLVAATVLGGALYSMYPVIVAHACDRADADAFLRVSGGLLLMFGIGAIAGPLAAGLAMALRDPYALFLTTFLAHLVIIAYTLVRLRLREPIRETEKTGFVSVPPARLATPETAALDPRAPDLPEPVT